uniref:Cytochrome b n=1 Tax=Aspiculuris tetraptera TaxID=451377 RepID=A0A141HAU0_9BILA|nr:cytochrome b [Aspiculuris tetraptera]
MSYWVLLFFRLLVSLLVIGGIWVVYYGFYWVCSYYEVFYWFFIMGLKWILMVCSMLCMKYEGVGWCVLFILMELVFFFCVCICMFLSVFFWWGIVWWVFGCLGCLWFFYLWLWDLWVMFWFILKYGFGLLWLLLDCWRFYLFWGWVWFILFGVDLVLLVWRLSFFLFFIFCYLEWGLVWLCYIWCFYIMLVVDRFCIVMVIMMSFVFFLIIGMSTYYIFFLLGCFFFLVLGEPFGLGDTEMFMKHNSLSSPVHIAPEGNFLFAYAILRAVPKKVLGVVFMKIKVFMLLLLIFWKSGVPGGVVKYLGMMLVFSGFMLTWLGANFPEAPYLFLSQGLTFFFFFFFFKGGFIPFGGNFFLKKSFLGGVYKILF